MGASKNYVNSIITLPESSQNESDQDQKEKKRVIVISPKCGHSYNNHLLSIHSMGQTFYICNVFPEHSVRGLKESNDGSEKNMYHNNSHKTLLTSASH